MCAIQLFFYDTNAGCNGVTRRAKELRCFTPPFNHYDLAHQKISFIEKIQAIYGLFLINSFVR